MRKFTMLLALVASAMMVNAQERGFYGNKFTDNWYVGGELGVGTMTTHQALLKNLNPSFGVKVGKYFSPIFGVGVEGNAFTSNKAQGHNLSGDDYSGINYFQVGIFASVNLMNTIYSYYGEPRRFEVQPMLGFYWGHNNSNNALGTHRNTLVNKLGVDVFYNIGKKKMFQIFVEPSINYAIAGAENEEVNAQGVGNEIVKYNINNSYLALNIGLNYKFLTSNGTHNFLVVEACDQTEIDDLNNSVNALRQKASTDEDKMAELQKEIDRLKQALKECQDKPGEDPELPAVFYPLNKSIISAEQAENVAIAARLMQKHPDIKLQIKGYASPEGPHDNNTSLGNRRAEAVKQLLIEKYGIDASRLTTEGCGETDQLYKIFELNRVATLSIFR